MLGKVLNESLILMNYISIVNNYLQTYAKPY